MPAPETSSRATTRGIRVEVQSRYLAERSDPLRGRFVFGYRVRVSNLGDAPVQLVSRHWIITDGAGEVEHVRGPGVIGEQPHLLPGQGFEYTSGAVLPTQRGTMSGSYQMVLGDDSTFDAEIACFALEVPHSLN